jgi:hypothetical protein
VTSKNALTSNAASASQRDAILTGPQAQEGKFALGDATGTDDTNFPDHALQS